MSSCPVAQRARLQRESKETARIIIVGSGPAGIAAATRLLEHGFRHVRILEAEDRIGGRINTIPYGDNVIDLGAQWCHGEVGNVVYERVKDLDMVTKTGDFMNTFRFLRSNRELVPQPTANALRTAAENSIPDGPNAYDGSMGDYLTHKYWQEVAKMPDVDRAIASEMFESFKRGECGTEGSDTLFELSGRSHLEFVECKGDLLIHWRNKGYASFLRLLMHAKEDVPGDLGVLSGKVQLSKRVSQINWEGDNDLVLRCWNGELMAADHVICTMSLGVLKEQHCSLFLPSLPEAKVRAIRGLKLGTVDKLFLEFAVQPLPQNWSGVHFLWMEQDLKELRDSKHFWLESVFAIHRFEDQPRMLEGWIIGEHARYMETLQKDEVLEGLMWMLRKFLPFDLPQPKSFLRTQWHSNPHFRGSYSFRSTYTDELQTGPWDLAAPLTNACGKPRLQFAGEASSRTHYSTVHGATETGWREADRLNEYYARGSGAVSRMQPAN
ncbi:PREDICTED: protein anon-37Cs-like [Drosophila arizonae]|uniref:Protein anon-37Cs-like n=1 Tax=Drosophila arizonae TaxID=7263 RepID=A0ABM1P8C0_DROAR|nr:PREDICTED: protein anon-37Cs-like [Drosophila arizonae]